MRPEIDDRWISYFQNKGYPQATGIAAGMEGAVYSLIPGKLVAKVWSLRDEPELQKLQDFYRKTLDSDGTIQTPEILEIDVVDGTLISKERFLQGIPLSEYLEENARHVDHQSVKATISVLKFLHSIPGSEELCLLPVLDEAKPLWFDTTRWSDAVGGLLLRRVARFGNQLRADISNLDDILEAIKLFLKTRDSEKMSLIHGDLCGSNIMVNSEKHPLSVFDFGFLSSAGDPAFDASITSAIFNIYGPYAQDIDDEVTDAFIESLNLDRHILLSYRAVYSIITSNAYSLDGSDGHYRWCVAMLQRADVQSSLGL
jgi:thiamine kinase-like enzyme